MTNPELRRKIAEVKGWKGIGYYGPPEDGAWTHERSVMFDTAEAAGAAYAAYWDKAHAAKPDGVMGRDDHSPDLCYWEEGWGPVYVPDWDTDIEEAWELLEEMGEDGIVAVRRRDKNEYEVVFEGDVTAESDTAPRAIALAYLEWKGVKNGLGN